MSLPLTDRIIDAVVDAPAIRDESSALQDAVVDATCARDGETAPLDAKVEHLL